MQASHETPKHTNAVGGAYTRVTPRTTEGGRNQIGGDSQLSPVNAVTSK